jgi:hypothetical protein
MHADTVTLNLHETLRPISLKVIWATQSSGKPAGRCATRRKIAPFRPAQDRALESRRRRV